MPDDVDMHIFRSNTHDMDGTAMISMTFNPAKRFPVPAVEGLKVLIADDHSMVRDGLRLSLQSMDANVRVLEADTVDSAVETYQAHSDIDLVLLDLSMPGAGEATALDGFIHECPDARVVVVSATCDMHTVQAAFRKGVLGFIPKLAGKSAFLSALRFVLDGGLYIPPEAVLPTPVVPAAAAANERMSALPAYLPLRPAQSPNSDKLTARQIDVLAQLLEGKSNKLICRELNLAIGTVKCHVAAILGALDVSSRAEAIAAADRYGWRQRLSHGRLLAAEAA